MERGTERETELESVMYTNCLLLGLDPSIIGSNRVGLFRHLNSKLGEHLLYFILSSIKGPKAFDKVWPIFDKVGSSRFRKAVHKIISELESQGALSNSHSRVSSLATCCGSRFVELLWQLSLHALREVHRRTYAADVVSNPLPASLTDVAFSHAARLLPITKARIALERRRFLKNAETAVQMQAMWSNLAHKMTTEYRSLCAEEAYLQQELEKLHDQQNKVKMEGEPWDEPLSTSSQNSHLVPRATRLWDSLLSLKSQHELLASGPVEDMIAHREHRYRISGSSLLAAMDESIQDSSLIDNQSGKCQPAVDIAKVLRQWTHALQHIHKQSLHMAKENDGEGPDLLRSANDGSTSGHAKSLAATLAEHRQRLASIQVLVNQLKGVAPVMENSISELSKEVNNVSTNLHQVTNYHGRSTSRVRPQSTGRTMESSSDDVTYVTTRLSSVHIDKVSSGAAALKLPSLFSLTPNSGGNIYKKQAQVNNNLMDNVSENLLHEHTVPNSPAVTSQTDNENDYIRNLKKSVREAALSTRPSNMAQSQDSHFEHFFVPLSGTGFSRVGSEMKVASLRSKQLFVPESQTCFVENHVSGFFKYNESLDTVSNFDMMNDYDGLNYAKSEGWFPVYDVEESHEHVFSPPFFMDASQSADSFEDLLAPLSETETALMEL